MSGGHFEYHQDYITSIIEVIKQDLERQGKKADDSLYYNEDYYYPVFSLEVQKIMRDAIKHLEIAYIYAKRIDWYISCDDSEDSLKRKLKVQLEKLNKNN